MSPPPDPAVEREEEVRERERDPDQEQDIHVDEGEDPPDNRFKARGDEDHKPAPDQEIPEIVLLSCPRESDHHAREQDKERGGKGGKNPDRER